MITLTQRTLAGATVSTTRDAESLIITINANNHGISIDTSCYVNVSGLDYYSGNLAGTNAKIQDIFNGKKLFVANTINTLQTSIDLNVYPNIDGIIGGSPVVAIDNVLWELEKGRYLIQTVSGANVNWNNNKIKIYAEYTNGDVSQNSFYPQLTNLSAGEVSIDGRILTFDGYVNKAFITLQNIDSITNIPLLISKQ